MTGLKDEFAMARLIAKLLLAISPFFVCTISALIVMTYDMESMVTFIIVMYISLIGYFVGLVIQYSDLLDWLVDWED